MNIGNKIVLKKIQDDVKMDIESLFRSHGINNIKIIFDGARWFWIVFPFKETEQKISSDGVHPDLLSLLQKNGYQISMILADKIDGMKWYGMVKKSI